MCHTHTQTCRRTVTDTFTHTHTDTHIATSPPVPLDFVNTEVTPVTRKYKSRNVAIIPIPIATVFRELFMNDEIPLCRNRDILL